MIHSRPSCANEAHTCSQMDWAGCFFPPTEYRKRFSLARILACGSIRRWPSDHCFSCCVAYSLQLPSSGRPDPLSDTVLGQTDFDVPIGQCVVLIGIRYALKKVRNTHTHTHTHAHTHAHTHTHMRTHARTHTRAHTSARTHKRTHAYAHTHALTQNKRGNSVSAHIIIY